MDAEKLKPPTRSSDDAILFASVLQAQLTHFAAKVANQNYDNDTSKQVAEYCLESIAENKYRFSKDLLEKDQPAVGPFLLACNSNGLLVVRHCFAFAAKQASLELNKSDTQNIRAACGNIGFMKTYVNLVNALLQWAGAYLERVSGKENIAPQTKSTTTTTTTTVVVESDAEEETDIKITKKSKKVHCEEEEEEEGENDSMDVEERVKPSTHPKRQTRAAPVHVVDDDELDAMRE